MYEGDAPNAERRAAALSLDRDLLRELLGQEELRDLIDADALARVEDDLQHRSERTQATSRDALHDVLRRVGDLRGDEAAGTRPGGLDAAAMLAELERERRAVSVRIGGERRWIAADEAGLYRDALGVVPPGGLPAAFLADVPHARAQLAARYGASHGPFTGDELRARYGLDFGDVLEALERDGELVRGELRPGGSEREWCDVEVLRRLRRASLAALREEIEPADQRALATFLPGWHGIDRHPATGRRRGSPARGARAPAGARAAGGGLGARRAAAAGRRLLADLAGLAVRQRRGRVGGRRRDRPGLGSRRALLPRGCGGDRPPGAARPRVHRARRRAGGGAGAPAAPQDSIHALVRPAERGALFLHAICSPSWTRRRSCCRRRCGTWCGPAR